jgi:hypothetical protein
MNLKLKRIYFENYTIGCLYVNKQLLCFTLELPNKENQKNISCIPEGEYKFSRYDSPKFGKCFRISDVKDRSDILIHTGNFLKDTHGCILVGKSVSIKDNNISVLESRSALNSLISYSVGFLEKEFVLNIFS